MINKRLLGLLENSKKYIKQIVLWNWFSLICNVIYVFTIANLLNTAINTRQIGIGQMILSAGIVIVCVLMRMFFIRQSAHASYQSSVDVKETLRQLIYKKLLTLGVSYNEKVSTSEVVQVAAEGIEQLEIYFGRYIPQFFYCLLAPFTLFLIFLPISWKTAVILLVCVPLIPASIIVVQKFAKKLLNKYWGAYTALGDNFLDNLQGLTTLKIYQADEECEKKMDIEAEHFRRVTMRVLIMQLNSISIMDLVAFGGSALGIIMGILEYAHGSISFASMFAIIVLSAEFFIPMRLFGSYFHIAMNGSAAADKIFRILESEDAKMGEFTIDSENVEIHGSNVDFSYEEGRQVLTNVNFSITPGHFIALAGESGCGKSTLSSILMGIKKGYKGSITINGKELSKIKESSIMENITMISHSSYLFKGTIRDNLRMGKKDATDKEMEDALKKVNLYDFVHQQDGLDTVLAEMGTNLSGGQRQRLAMARALLHDTPVYIFDEATSNIDMESENKIMEVVKELAKTKTVILISHRLANVVSADKIFVLENGQIKEEGTHKELLLLNNVYARLYKSQAQLENYTKGDMAHA